MLVELDASEADQKRPKGAGLSPDERILCLLAAGPGSSRSLADALAWNDRAIRRRLRRLIGDGYVFSPSRGIYRLTASGRAVLEADEGQESVGLLDATPRYLLQRWTKRR